MAATKSQISKREHNYPPGNFHCGVWKSEGGDHPVQEFESSLRVQLKLPSQARLDLSLVVEIQCTKARRGRVWIRGKEAVAREKETLSLVRESRDRGKIVGQRPSRQRARVPANYEADTADKRSESAHAICIPRRETIVPSILWVRKLYEDGDEETKRMRSNVSTFETTLVYVFLHQPSFSVDSFKFQSEIVKMSVGIFFQKNWINVLKSFAFYRRIGHNLSINFFVTGLKIL